MKTNKKYPQNKKPVWEADLITGGSLTKFTDPWTPAGWPAILKMPMSALVLSSADSLLKEKYQ